MILASRGGLWQAQGVPASFYIFAGSALQHSGGCKLTTQRKIFLLGQPLGHSLSPAFQNAGLEHLGLEVRYEARVTSREELPGVVTQIRRGEVAGANVTLPWKEAVAELVDRLSPAAQRTGAVNTLVRRAGQVEGHNTDVPGLRRALEEQGFGPGGVERAAVLGAGGAARAAVVALDQLGAREILLLNRSAERARALATSLRGGNCANIAVVPSLAEDREQVTQALASVELLVHATSLAVGSQEGQEAFTQATEHWGQALPWEQMEALRGVHDLCYGRTQTPFLKVARGYGFSGVDGTQMLLYQGIASFLLWTRREPPEEVMRQALRQARGQE
jgi:shikimate dehydrogenase